MYLYIDFTVSNGDDPLHAFKFILYKYMLFVSLFITVSTAAETVNKL